MIKRLVMLAMILMLAACSTGGPGDATPALDETALPSPTVTAVPPGVWVQPGVPIDFAERVLDVLGKVGFVRVDNADDASIKLVLDPPADAPLTSELVYVLVAPFPTAADDISLADLQAYWQGRTDTLPGFDTPPKFIVSSSNSRWSDADWLFAAFFTQLGLPVISIPIVHETGVLENGLPVGALFAAYDDMPSLSIIAFDKLQSMWKVFTIDGMSVLDKNLDTSTYPLTVKVGLVGNQPALDRAVQALQPDWLSTNRDASKISSVVVTGVTALTRSTAWYIENEGADFPSLNIAPFFADHDILHVSSEVSFTPKCPPPDLFAEKFCAKPAYLDVLTLIGVDIVELTGNHNNDFGISADLFTLDLYDQTGIPHYGGGRTMEEAMKPHILTTPDGTRVAFVGCNSTGPFPAYATAETPGAAPCADWAWIKQTIHDLKANNLADVVIATVQYHESQSYTPEEQQVPDFAALTDAGADIVSGSQAHVPQGFLITPTGFIHYGVGNLFFDQMDFIENRQMFADKHILYGGRHISTVLFTGIIEDYSQPRPMTPQERADFLKLIFSVGGS